MCRNRKYKRMIKRLETLDLTPQPAPKNKTVLRGNLDLDRAEVEFFINLLNAKLREKENA